ncbi:hypothetical protein D3C86_1117120 [compost metagenome]
MLGRDGAEGLAFVGLVAVQELGGGVGVTGDDAPVVGQVAAQLGFPTLAACLAFGHVGTGGVVVFGAVFIVDAKGGDAGVQATVVEFALEADFVLLAFARADRLAVCADFALRLEHAGVAEVGRQFRGDLADDGAVRHDLAVDAGVGFAEVVEEGVGVLRIAFVPGHAAAADDIEPVGDVELGAGVDAVLIGLGPVAVDVRIVVAGNVDAARIPHVDREVLAAAVGEVLVQVLVLGAHGELVPTIGELERRGDEAVDADGLDVGVVVVGHGPAVTGGRVDRAVGPGEVTLRGFGVAVGQGGLELTAVVQFVVEFGEGFPDFFVEGVPLGIDEGRARYVEQ